MAKMWAVHAAVSFTEADGERTRSLPTFYLHPTTSGIAGIGAQIRAEHVARGLLLDMVPAGTVVTLGVSALEVEV